jgi:hypothetical protein
MKDLYKDRLGAVDDVLMNALVIVFDEILGKYKPKIQEGEDNSILGEKYRSYQIAEKMLNDILIELRSYKTENPKPKTFNKAR